MTAFRDILDEAVNGVASRPGRFVLTLIGTVLGVGTLLVTLSLGQTATAHLSETFRSLSSTQVVVEPAKSRGAEGKQTPVAALPWDAVERVSGLAGVEAAALIAPVDLRGATVSATELHDPTRAHVAPPPVWAGTGMLFDALRADLLTGRFFDQGHDHRGERVVVLGEAAAERLGINRVNDRPAIFLGDRAYAVVGIMAEPGYREDLAEAVIVPLTAARRDFGLEAAESLQVRVRELAGPEVGRQATIALNPSAPDEFTAQTPIAGTALESGIRSDLSALLILLGSAVLLAGAAGIASVTTLGVWERRSEIGLRRALGATGRDIAVQFVLEAVLCGALGGVIAAAVSIPVVVVVSAAQGWSPVIDPVQMSVGVLAGAAIGLISGVYPAVRAARIEPIAALRSAG